jgi:hypothetical protein
MITAGNDLKTMAFAMFSYPPKAWPIKCEEFIDLYQWAANFWALNARDEKQHRSACR